MNLIDKSYLHPVLRPGYDDVVGVFEFMCSDNVKIEADKYAIDIHAVFKNETIEKLIAEGKAKKYVFVYCEANFFRKAIEINSFEDQIEIPTEDLSGNVDLTLIVSVTEQMHYQNTSQHSDYGDMAFDIECGDILAVSNTISFFAEREYDSLRKIDSIISINADETMPRNAPLTIGMCNDKIKVAVPQKVFDDYMALTTHKRSKTTLENVIFLPILVSIISLWQQDSELCEEEYGQYRWFRAIKARANSLNLINDICVVKQDPFVLAQIMLDAPITRCIDEVMNQWISSEGEEE